MGPKSGKPLRLFNPFSIWTNFALKSGEAMLDAAQAMVARGKTPKVGVIHAEDAPRRKAARGKTSKANKATKARKSASSRGKRRGR